MHYQGMLRIVRREQGIRVYAAHEHRRWPEDEELRRQHIDALADTAIRIYAPLPAKSLSFLLRRLRFAVPQWQGEISSAIQRAKERLASTQLNGVAWYWPTDWRRRKPDDAVRLLTPFDPIVWDRDRFELLWGWTYRFEAYTPPAKRKLGYYALPLLWRDQVIGWGNLLVKDGALQSEVGYVGAAPTDKAFKHALAEELDRIRVFMGLASAE
jgi:uncharacterized protein YcaQ